MNIRDVNAGVLLNRVNELTATQNGLGAQQAAGNNANRQDRLILTPEGEQMRTNLLTQRLQGNLQTGILAQKPQFGAVTKPLTQPQGQAGQAAVGGNERTGILEQNPQGENTAPAGNTALEQTQQGLNQRNEGVANLNEQQQNPGGIQPRENTAAQERENTVTQNAERTNQDNLTRYLQMEAERALTQNQINQNPVLDLLG